MNWQPDIERLTETLDAVFAEHPLFEERLRQWRLIGDFPPVLVTATGWLVNGHHRLAVARERGSEVWGLIVEPSQGGWVVTGNVVRVR